MAGTASSFLDCLSVSFDSRTSSFFKWSTQHLHLRLRPVGPPLILAYRGPSSNKSEAVQKSKTKSNASNESQNAELEKERLEVDNGEAGRKKMDASRAPPRNNGTVRSRKKLSTASQDLVRTVVNAEDSCNEEINFLVPVIGQRASKALKNKSRATGLQAHFDDKETTDCSVSDVPLTSSKESVAINGVDTQIHESSVSVVSSSKRKKSKWKQQRKRGVEPIEQDNHQTQHLSDLKSEGVTSAMGMSVGHFEGHSSHNTNEVEELELHMNAGTDGTVWLEYDAKVGGNVVDVTDYLESLPPRSAVHDAIERRRKLSQNKKKKKKNKGLHLEQHNTVNTDELDVSGAANMSQVEDADIQLEFLDEDSDHSSSGNFSLLEQPMSPVKDQQGYGEYSKGKSVHEEHDANVDTIVAVSDDRDVKGMEERVESHSQLLQHTRWSKRSRKQQLVEELKGESRASDFYQSDPAMCTVRWFVETQLKSNQRPFLVGENINLGGWDPDLAVSFSFCQESKSWQAESQLPFGINTEYTYFVQVDNDGTTHRVWRPGPRLLLKVPASNASPDSEVTVRDILDFVVANKLPTLIWEGLHNEIGFPTELRRFFGQEVVSIDSSNQPKLLGSEANIGKNSAKSKEWPASTVQDVDGRQLKVDGRLKGQDVKSNDSGKRSEGTMRATKPQPEEESTPQKVTQKLKRYIRKKVFPREEPWLMESMILAEKIDAFKPTSMTNTETDPEVGEKQEVLEKEPSPPEEEKKDFVTEILISSSKCTMERIAILEDGKLVELLLKPVNSDISVGSVYLGIVKRLLPGMTGVFVDIGHPRAALLTITKNMYPFTFPPIEADSSSTKGHSTGKQENGSLEFDEKDDHPAEEWESEDENDEEDDELDILDELEELGDNDTNLDVSYGEDMSKRARIRKVSQANGKVTRPVTVNFGQRFTKWRKVEEGMQIIVQVKREPLGKKGPKVCAFPMLSSRFWVLGMGGKSTGVSKKISGPERKRLKELASKFRKPGFDLTVRTEAAGQTEEDLEKDLWRLSETWKEIMEQAEAASMAVDSGEDGAVPALLHSAMGQTLSIVRDFFAENVQRMVVDCAQTYHEVTSYLQEVAPQLQSRVELYTGTTPIFDAFNIDADIDQLLNERVQLPNGAYLVIEETEALVSIDVNGGAGMLGKNMKSAAILEANLAAARQIAAELRLRDIGGIIVIDFIDMDEIDHESLVYEEMKKAIQSDRSVIYISEISELGLMELTRRRVRPSVTLLISDPCSCCRGTGRVEALETTFSKIERAILRLVANHVENIHFDGRMWKKVLLRVDPVMFEYLTKRQRAAQLSRSLEVYIILKVGREMTRGSFEVSEVYVGMEKRLEKRPLPSPSSGPHRRILCKTARLGAVAKKDPSRT